MRCSLIALALLAVPLHAQTTSPTTQPRQLTIQELATQVAKLQAESAKLRQEIAALRLQLPPATQNLKPTKALPKRPLTKKEREAEELERAVREKRTWADPNIADEFKEGMTRVELMAIMERNPERETSEGTSTVLQWTFADTGSVAVSGTVVQTGGSTGSVTVHLEDGVVTRIVKTKIQ